MTIRLIASLTLCVCLASTALAQSSKKPLRAAGRIDAVSQGSITIVLPGDNKITLVVDNTTKLTGRGLGTRANMTAEGHPASLEGLVKPSDSVVVTYSEPGGGKLHATEIHVRFTRRGAGLRGDSRNPDGGCPRRLAPTEVRARSSQSAVLPHRVRYGLSIRKRESQRS